MRIFPDRELKSRENDFTFWKIISFGKGEGHSNNGMKALRQPSLHDVILQFGLH